MTDEPNRPAEPEFAPGPFYIQAASPRDDEQIRVLKQGDTFAVFDHYGDIKPSGLGEEGIFHDGTRYLSGLILLLDQHRPLFLSSTVKEENDLLTVDLTNPDLLEGDRVAVPRGTLHILRSKLLWQGACYEHLRIKNFGTDPVVVRFALHFRADFVDIFEVRGNQRPRRGRRLAPVVDMHSVVLAYHGLDGLPRRTRLSFDPPPETVAGTEAVFRAALPPHAETALDVVISCEQGATAATAPRFEAALADSSGELREARRRACTVRTSHPQFNDWINRAIADLAMMTTTMPSGPYPYAGVPWFSTPFGRDALITAQQCLWLDPALARGVLGFLAATQATEMNPAQDAEPGKILHEARGGEMAALGEVPFGRYYGSIDSTPLFLCLAGDYFRRTADRPFLQSLWPHVLAALDWIDSYGDRDGDGFVEYQRNSPNGLDNQGWKDSHDSVSHADGSLARGSIALCEVQGYVYAARLAAAELADSFGDSRRAASLRDQAASLRTQFHDRFWCDDRDTYALALDGEKKPCRVGASNAGHCLWTGLALDDAARRCGRSLLGERSFTGWGVRTLALGEARYNPMSYHNGSVWPHDNAIIAAGLARYGLSHEALRLLIALFDVSKAVDLHRLPELFCGFTRRPGQGPTRYPVACAPQAWSAAAVFLLLQATLGLSLRADPPEIRFSSPLLPDFLTHIEITNLRLGPASVDLRLRRDPDRYRLDILHQEGDIHFQLEN